MNQVQQSAASDLLNKGNEFFDQGSYESAIQEYIKVMQNNTERYQYFCERGMYFAQLGKDQEAIHNFIQQYNITLQDLAQYLRGMGYDYMEQYQDSLANFTQTIQRCPKFKYCYNDRGNTHSSLQEMEQAIQDYTEAIKLDNQYGVAYQNRGIAFSDIGRKEEAILDFTRAIEINTQDDQAYYSRGNAFNYLGRKEEAIKDYTKAIQINPSKDEAYTGRGDAFNDLGRKEEAIKDYMRAIEINPQDDKAYYNRGLYQFLINLQEIYIITWEEKKRPQQTIQEPQKQIHQMTKLLQQRLILDLNYITGVVLNDLGRKEEAIIDYTRAIEINPLNDQAYYNRGVVLHNLGRQKEAIEDYTRAIELNPQKDEAYNNRGNVLDDLGRKEEAIKDYTRAIEINPQDDEIYYCRGLLLHNLGRQKEAIEDYTRAIELNPQKYEAYTSRGFAMNNLGRNEEAIKDYTRAIEINPQYDLAYLNRGILLDELGRKKEAYMDYISAHQIQPQNPLYIIQQGKYLLSNGEKKNAYEFFVQGLKLASSLSQEDKIKFYLTEENLQYIQEQVELVQKIEQEISKVNFLLKSKTLSENEQNILQEKIKPIEAEFQQQINKPLKKDNNDKDNNILQQILKELNDLKQNQKQLQQQNIELTQKVIYLENQRPQIIIKEMIQLKSDDNKYMYYQSLYWRLFNYISACQQLSTDLFQKNTDAVIDNDKERVAQITIKVVQQISNQSGSIPIVGTVITIISSALEFAFSYHLDYKFNQIVRKLTQIVQERCDSGTNVAEEIQLAIIKQSKQLGELTLDKQLKEQELLEHVEKIQQAEKDSGNLQAQDQYWRQGIVDTLRILRNLLVYQKQISLDKKKELHIVILESLKDEEWQKDHHQVVNNSKSLSERCCNNCSIQ